jgi:eukaryotic-like serine/threonine-protein kinase
MQERLSPERWRVVIPYLDRALELDGGQRDSWLLALREEDAALAGDVATLLEKHARLDAQGYLDEGVDGGGRRTSLAGQVLGAYTLREQIGQGGMGSVWLADRTDGRYQGAAAVKLLNPSLLGREGEGRFRREGSILARLRHPNIAQLIDAGVSPAGQPYLVLEHVDGQRIDSYCDDRKLPVEARVRQFLDVLSAVAHAHANLVVHRDLKPSNVMVGADGRVKLLDFGIAKLVGLEPGEATALTGDGAQVMTPQYAAPEQLAGGDVSTATDVYALGALLYLLVTGCHPSGSETGSPAELIRAIVETEPARPSEAALLEVPDADTAEERASCRSATPKKLVAALRGDLDNIVAKALKKAPSERYATVEALAADLRAHLAHQVVGARADSLRYRASRFLRRHRLATSVGALLVLTLVGGLAATSWQYVRAQREAARAHAVTDFLIRLFELSSERRPQSEKVTAREILDQGTRRLDADLADQPALQANLLGVMGRVYSSLGFYEPAGDLLERSLTLLRRQHRGDDADLARVLSELSTVRNSQGEYDRAIALARESVDMQRRVHGGDHPEISVTLQRLGEAELDAGRPAEAAPIFQEALAMRRRLYGNAHPEVVSSLIALTNLNFETGDYALAEAQAREALAIARTISGDSYPVLPLSIANLAAVVRTRGRNAEAITLLDEALKLFRARLGEEHPELAPFMRTLAAALQDVGRTSEAAETFERTLQIERASLGAEHPEVAKTTHDLADLLREEGRFAEAEVHYRDCLAILGKSLPPNHVHVGRATTSLGLVLVDQGRYAEAESSLRRALSILEAGLPPGHDLTAKAQIGLGRALLGQGRRLAEAQGLLAAATDVYRAKFGADDVRTAEAGLALADCLMARGRPQEARALARESLPALVKAFGDSHERTRHARKLSS